MIRTFSQSYKIPKKNCKSSNANPPVDELKSPIINEMKKHKNVFFIVHLHSVESASRLGVIFLSNYVFINYLNYTLSLSAYSRCRWRYLLRFFGAT